MSGVARLHASGPDGQAMPVMVAGGDQLILLSFTCMKLLPARSIIEAGAASGQLQLGAKVLLTSSGTFGYGAAQVCGSHGYELIVVSDPAIDPRFARVLAHAGARVEIVAAPAAVGGYQQARLDRVDELSEAYPGAFVADQYGDAANPAAYESVAESLVGLGEIDILVGTVGSGGSVCGLARGLRRANPSMTVVGVDTPRSVVFGCDDGARLLRGLGNSLVPGNVDHTAFDDIHWIDAPTAFSATHRLYRRHGLFQGPTSGAAFAVAEWYAARWPDARIVTVLPDAGWRYLDTVYDSEWLASKTRGATPCVRPQLVGHPLDVRPDRWSWLSWGRRTRAAVVGHRAVAP